MEEILIGALVFAVIFLGARLWCYRRQTDYLLKQISLWEQEDTNYCLSSYCRIGKTEKLIGEFNRVWQKNRERMIALKKGNRSYRESIMGISHDIRTPLTSAKGYTQMLLKGSLTDLEKQQRYIEKVEQRIDDVVDMLDQLFEYARVEAGERSFCVERINLNNIFADTLSLFYDDFVQAGCEPAVDISETPLYIEADADGVKRIIENLIKNALVHGKKDVHGNEEYRFSVEKQDGQAVITMSNLTDSIEKSDMEHIFERFYTTDQSRTRKTTGLGLAIVRQFTESMGGNVSADLTEGVFSVRVAFISQYP